MSVRSSTSVSAHPSTSSERHTRLARPVCPRSGACAISHRERHYASPKRFVSTKTDEISPYVSNELNHAFGARRRSSPFGSKKSCRGSHSVLPRAPPLDGFPPPLKCEAGL